MPTSPGLFISIEPGLIYNISGNGGFSTGWLSEEEIEFELIEGSDIPTLSRQDNSSSESESKERFFFDFKLNGTAEIGLDLDLKLGIGAGFSDEEVFVGLNVRPKYTAGGVGVINAGTSGGDGDVNCFWEVEYSAGALAEVKFPGISVLELSLNLFNGNLKEEFNCNGITYEPCQLAIDEQNISIRCTDNGLIFIEGVIEANCQTPSRICANALNARQFDLYLNGEILGNLNDDRSRFTYNSNFRTTTQPFTGTAEIQIIDREEPEKCGRFITFFEDEFGCDDDGPCVGDFSLTHEGVSYKVEGYGSQVWITENMVSGRGSTHSNDASSSTGVRKGLLYSWGEVMNDEEIDNIIDETLQEDSDLTELSANSFNDVFESTQGICPLGYHVPSRIEWRNLINYFQNQFPNRPIEEMFADPDLDFCAPTDRGALIALDGGTNIEVDNETIFWSSTIGPFESDKTGFGRFYAFHLTDTDVTEQLDFHINKYSCRCIKD